MSLIFFVFSYNRGPYLNNCIESIEQCAPGHSIIIYDDNSDDPETLEVLEVLGQKYTVCKTEMAESEEQHGALYVNMQSALDSVSGDQLISFLQDDTQLVRALSDDDLQFIENYFQQYPKAGFLAPVFQKRITRAKTLKRFQFNENRCVYEYEDQTQKAIAGVYYSDISITRSGRLREVSWKFMPDEYENELQAKRVFFKMGYVKAPFAMWLPNPQAYRNKKKSLAFKIAERVNRAGLYPFSIMTPARASELKNRLNSEIPIAENYLSVSVEGLKQPWIFHPLRRSRILRRLEKTEKFFKKFF